MKQIFWKTPAFFGAALLIAALSVFIVFSASRPSVAEDTVAETTAAVPAPAEETADAEAAEPEEKPLVDMIAATTERSLGDPNAPVTIIEYASMTCQHCSNFHKNTFNDVKKAYIDTGKVYWIFREFPLDRLALRASQAARCVTPSMYFNFVEVLFTSQERWTRDDDPMKALAKTARLAGLSQDAFDACIDNRDLEGHILQNMHTGQTQWKVKSTPTFVFNYGAESLSGAQSFEAMQKVIEGLLR